MLKLKDKVAIISGSTSGIGEACAYKFASEGAKVVISGRNEEKGKIVEKNINDKISNSAIFVKSDISIESDVKNLVDTTIKSYGKLDILFNNAGVMLPSMEIERMSIADWEQTFNVNVKGYFLLTRYAKQYLLKNDGGGGVILNNASIAGLQHYVAGRSYAYSASKAAIIQFSHQMAKNYGCENIRVNCICPGIIQTDMLHSRDPKIYEDRIPLGRVGNVEDVANVALFLVSDESSYLTGLVLPIDGGASL